MSNEIQANLKQARVALLEARMSGEMADLIRRYNGQPYSVPAVREVRLESKSEVATFIEQLTQHRIDIVVFFTGVGVSALFQEAEALGRAEELRNGLQETMIVCRGPKPSAIVRKQKLPIHLNTPEPYTTTDLLAALQTLDVAGKTVAVLHYGERNTQITQELEARSARIEELCLYEWLLPEDTTSLKELIIALENKQVAAIIFMSQVHVRHLFQIANEMQHNTELQYALNQNTVVASVGPTCTAILQEYGVQPHVIPEHPKMGYLVKALAEHMSTL